MCLVPDKTQTEEDALVASLTGQSLGSCMLYNTTLAKGRMWSGSAFVNMSLVNPDGSITPRQERYSGITNASGNYTVVFGTPYLVAPNIQPNIIAGTALQRTITTVTTTGFTINVVSQNTNNLLGIINLISSTTNVVGAALDVLVTEK